MYLWTQKTNYLQFSSATLKTYATIFASSINLLGGIGFESKIRASPTGPDPF
jgi:hypothetical protein